MPTVSVVIATYNRAALVRQAVEAALAQTRPPEEIVVSDDASTDATPEVLAALSVCSPRLRVYKRESNSGGVGNWNDAMRRARGDFLALCSDDDRFMPDHLEASLAYFEEHPEVGVVHSGFVDVMETPDGAFIHTRPLRSKAPLTITREGLLPYMTRYYDWPVHPSTLVIRREVWNSVGEFNPDFQLTDTEWFIRAAEACPVVLLPRHGVYNRRHVGNWSNRLGSAWMQREIFEIVEAAIARRWARQPAVRALWRAVWRANVRMRLTLTLFKRLRSGHVEAAGALWRGLLRDTGRRFPQRMEACGLRLVQVWCLLQVWCRSTAPSPRYPSVTPL